MGGGLVPPGTPGRTSAEAAAKDKADRMKAYLEEKYERLKRDKEEEKDHSGEENKEKAKGIEMQQEFDAELEDLSEDEVRISRAPSRITLTLG